MPTYEYECGKCGHCFESFQRMSDPPLKTCPKCRGKVRRLISGGAGLIFKGSGFYITDYARKGKKPSEDSSGSGKTDPKTDSSSSKSADK